VNLEAFEEWAIGAGYARRSVRLYAGQVRRAQLFFDQHGADVDDVPASLVRAYAETLPRTLATQALLRSALRAYWASIDRPHPPAGAVRLPKARRMVCRALDDRHAGLVAAHAATRGDRAGLATLFALYAGLRRAEIASLRWADIGSDSVRVIGKGDVVAELPLHPLLAQAVAAYRDRPGDRGEYVFAGRFGGPVTPATVWGWVRQVGEDAGAGPVPTHVLRHTCLAVALDNTRDLRAVQELARHARPETTAGYTRVRRDRLVATVGAITYGSDIRTEGAA
jgi:integrase/recombinase XerD